MATLDSKIQLGIISADVPEERNLSKNIIGLFVPSDLDENIPMYEKGKPSEIYKNALSSRVVVGSKDGVDIELDTPLFFQWIGIDNPYVDFYKDSIKHVYKTNPAIF